MKAVRLYGHQLGHTSFTQVTHGFAMALGEIGAFGGFVPLDFFDDEAVYPGSSCPVSINTGMPSGVERAFVLGNHAERWLMLAPNSNRIPARMMEWLPEFATALLSPSLWGCGVLRELFGAALPVWYVPHGVHHELAMLPEARAERYMEFRHKNTFRVLHLTSTNSERKGTKLLIEAWKAFASRPGEHNLLKLIVRREGYLQMMALCREHPSIIVHPSDGFPYPYMNTLFGDAHVVCQPSRAEGFGLVPLEAKACGLPVVMTRCTGHIDHYALGASVGVETGADAPSDDMEGALSPSLTREAIYEALCTARDNYTMLDVIARSSAREIQEQYSWAQTTGTALKELLK